MRLPCEHPDVATSLHKLAGLYHRQRRYGEAEPLVQRALAIWERALGPAHPRVVTLREHYYALLREEAMQSDVQPSMTLLQRIRTWWSAKRDIR